MDQSDSSPDETTAGNSGPPAQGAQADGGHVSLEGLHRTVEVPHHQIGFWR